MKLLAKLSLIFLFVSSLAWGQATGAFVPLQTAFKVVNGQTSPVANATITVCAANTAGIPCSPALVGVIFKDAALTQPLANPFTADSVGNYQFAAAAGTYTVTVTASGFAGTSYQASTGSNGSGSGTVNSVISGGGLALGIGGTSVGMAICPALQIYVSDGTNWNCAPSTSGGNVSTAPVAAQNVVQPAVTGVSTPFSANNFAFWRVVTPSWNWAYTDSAGSLGNLTAAGSKTLTLPCTTPAPCPLGIDTTSAANHYIYRIYVSGTGTAEAALVTGGTCTPGAIASCTLVVTTAFAHPNGYTIGSASTGIQEAWNDAWVNDSGTAPVANASSAPLLKLSADTNYNVYSSIYLRGRGGILDAAGAYLICSTRDRCIYAGTTAGTNYHRIYNANGGSLVNQDGVQVASVCAGASCASPNSAGTYTVTTASTHGFVVGDTMDCEYYSQNAAQHWVAQAIAPTSGTTLTVSFGSSAFAASANTFGFCNILNAFIEDNSEHMEIKTVNIFSSIAATGTFSYGIVNDNDQQLQIDHLSNRGSSVLRSSLTNATANFPTGAMVYSRNDQGNNGISYVHNSEFTNVNCGTSGGNGFVVDNTVCQAFPVYGFRYFGGLQPATFTNIYEDVATDNALYHAIYGQAVFGQMGYLVQGGRENRIIGAFPSVFRFPTFPCTAGAGATRNYWVIPHVSAGALVGSPLFIGQATACNSGSITVAWPSIQLQDHTGASIGTLTWDILMTTTGATQAPVGTGSFYLTTPGSPVSGSCNTGGMCTFVDTQAAAVSGTIAAQNFNPNFWFWPAAQAINYGAALQMDSTDTSPGIVSSFGTTQPSVIAAQCPSFGTAAQRTPVWVTCGSTGGASGQLTVSQILTQKDGAGAGPVANSKGRLNLGSAVTAPNDLITLQDSNLQKSISTAGHRALNDAADIAIGTDVSGGLNFRAGTSIDFNLNSIPTGTNYSSIQTATGFTATAFGPTANNWKYVDGVATGFTSTGAVADNCETYPANTGLRTCVIYSPPELIATNPFPPNFAPEWRIIPGAIHTPGGTLCDLTHIYCVLLSRPGIIGSQGTIVGVGPVGTGGDMTSGSMIMNDPTNFPAPIGIPSSPGTMTCTAGATAYDFAILLVVPLNSHAGGSPPAGGPGAYAKYHLGACAASGNTFAMTGGVLPSGTLAGSLTPTEYEVGFSTTGANGPYFAQSAANLNCTAGVLNNTNPGSPVPYSCTIAGGSFSIAQANLSTTTMAFASDQATGNPVDLSNPLLFFGTPSTSVSFNEQLRDISVACQPTGQGVNNPNVLLYNFNGQEGAITGNGEIALYGDCGGYANISGAMIYTASQTPNSSYSHTQISGGPTSGATPFYGILVDAQINGTGGASGGPREVLDTTCALRAGGTAETCFLIQGSRARINFTDDHAEMNGARDNWTITQGARASFAGIEGSNSGGIVAHCTATAQACAGFNILAQGGNSASQDRCASGATAWQDDRVGGKTLKGCIDGFVGTDGFFRDLQLSSMTFAQLTAFITCAAGTEGYEASVTDDNTAIAFNAIITGSGANHVHAYCNGTNWVMQ